METKFQKILAARTRKLNTMRIQNGAVIYWMSREQRVQDNWALLAAHEQAVKSKSRLEVIFVLQKSFLEASLRQYDFMLQGLEEVANELQKLNIKFQIILGKPEAVLPKYIKGVKAGTLFADFSPLRISRKWKEFLAKSLDVAFFEVDAHNTVPVWTVSSKQEYAARTIRSKIHNKLEDFCIEIPRLKAVDGAKVNNKFKSKQLLKQLKINPAVKPISWLKSGSKAAKEVFFEWISTKLHSYENRNDPNANVLSNLSPYLHFGQISSERIVLELHKLPKSEQADIFLEELIVRKELAENYCFYNENYDNSLGFPEWARKTLHKHSSDKREYIYSLDDFELAHTHDELWNAAQIEMVSTGKMHGYMRMYWAKKILEWTKSPEEAQKIAIYLNDKYELDGRDPNGYAGIAWSIGGVHDRPWFERPVYGTIRYMNARGAAKKFAVKEYISKFRF